MTPRDIHFASYHQAAHVVSALLFGCRIEYVEIGNEADKIGWNLDSVSLRDTETVCGAGFEMERILGRRHELSWNRSDDDRVLLGTIHTDRTGETLTKVERDARFTAGADSSRSLLEHGRVRGVIDKLAEELNDAYHRGERRLEAKQISEITALVAGVAPAI